MVKNALHSHPLFRNTDPELQEGVIAASQLISVPCGETVYDRHRFQRCMGILLKGALQVRKEALLVSTLKTGDIFGAAALFHSGNDYPTTLNALEECRLILIPEETVRELIRTSPDFAENYVVYLSGRVRFLSARLDALSAEHGEGKLARYLLTAGGDSGSVKGTATELCQCIGVGRATLYRAFDVLEKEQAIRRDGKTIQILDCQKLRSLCERL